MTKDLTMPRTLTQLAEAYPNPMHPQGVKTQALLDAIERDDVAAAAEAAAALAYTFEAQGIGDAQAAVDNLVDSRVGEF